MRSLKNKHFLGGKKIFISIVTFQKPLVKIKSSQMPLSKMLIFKILLEMVLLLHMRITEPELSSSFFFFLVSAQSIRGESRFWDAYQRPYAWAKVSGLFLILGFQDFLSLYKVWGKLSFQDLKIQISGFLNFRTFTHAYVNSSETLIPITAKGSSKLDLVMV